MAGREQMPALPAMRTTWLLYLNRHLTFAPKAEASLQFLDRRVLLGARTVSKASEHRNQCRLCLTCV